MGTDYLRIFYIILLLAGARFLPGGAAAETGPNAKAGLGCSERDAMELLGKAAQDRAASLLGTGSDLEKLVQTIFNLNNADAPKGMCCCDEVGPVSYAGAGWWKFINMFPPVNKHKIKSG